MCHMYLTMSFVDRATTNRKSIKSSRKAMRVSPSARYCSRKGMYTQGFLAIAGWPDHCEGEPAKVWRWGQPVSSVVQWTKTLLGLPDLPEDFLSITFTYHMYSSVHYWMRIWRSDNRVADCCHDHLDCSFNHTTHEIPAIANQSYFLAIRLLQGDYRSPFGTSLWLGLPSWSHPARLQVQGYFTVSIPERVSTWLKSHYWFIGGKWVGWETGRYVSTFQHVSLVRTRGTRWLDVPPWYWFCICILGTRFPSTLPGSWLVVWVFIL